MRGFPLHRTNGIRIETARIMNTAVTENRIFSLGHEGARRKAKKNIPPIRVIRTRTTARFRILFSSRARNHNKGLEQDDGFALLQPLFLKASG